MQECNCWDNSGSWKDGNGNVNALAAAELRQSDLRVRVTIGKSTFENEEKVKVTDKY